MTENIITDKNLFIDLLGKGKGKLALCSLEIRNDKDIVTYSVMQDAFNYEYASDNLKSDKDICMIAIQKDAGLYISMPDKIKKDNDILKIAILKNPNILEYAPKEVRDNYEIIEFAVKRSGHSLTYASNRIKNDRKLVILAFETYYNSIEICSHYYKRKYKDSESFLLDAINSLKKGGVFDEFRFIKKFASKRIKDAISDQLPSEYLSQYVKVKQLKTTLELEMKDKAIVRKKLKI